MVCAFVFGRKWWQRLLWRRGQSASSQSSELRVYEDSPVFPRKYSGVGDDLLPDVSVERNVGESILAKGGVATGKGVASGGGVAARSRGSLGSEMEEVKIEDIHTSMKVAGNEVRVHRKWPTAWYWQFGVLTVRTFRHSRHIILSKLNILQTFLMAILAALLWFQMPLDEANIGDREGYVSLGVWLCDEANVGEQGDYVGVWFRCFDMPVRAHVVCGLVF